MKQGYITPRQLKRVVRLRELALGGADRAEAMEESGLTRSGFKTLLRRFTGSEGWPARFPDAIFDLPVRKSGTGIAKAERVVEPVMRDGIADLYARIERDQAERRAERERWLEIERTKYSLPRRGRLIDEMAA